MLAFDLILLAVLAVFLAIRLSKVLGQRTGEEKKPQSSEQPESAEDASPVDQIIDVLAEPASDDEPAPAPAKRWPPAVRSGLLKLQAIDVDFDDMEFLSRAEKAFIKIIQAYAGGDLTTIDKLVGGEVKDGFVAAIHARQQKNEVVEVQLVGAPDIEIVKADIVEQSARLTLRIMSQQRQRLTSPEKTDVPPLLESSVQEVEDVWTFARDYQQESSRWLLVKIHDPMLA